MTMTALAEGTVITTHERVIALRPLALVTPDGTPVEAVCDGEFRVQPGDRGRGPIFVECDVCGKPMGLKRREASSTPPLAAVGAWTDPDDDGYARF